MTNKVYPKYKDAAYGGAANVSIGAGGGSGATGLWAALVDLGTYTYSDAHEFYSSLSGVLAEVEVTSQTLSNGLLDGADITWPTVSGATGEAIVLYRKNAGANTTWRLVAFIDTGVTGLPVTPNSGDINTTWNAGGIVQF